MNEPQPNVTIRPYRPSDQPGVEWLYSRTPPWGRTYPRPEPVPGDIRNISSAFEYVVVAVEQDRAGEAVVGLTTVAPARPDATVPMPAFFDLNRPTARLHHVTVAPERWRQGIGRLLVQGAIGRARQAGYRSLILNTTTDQRGAVAFYFALGFREAGYTTFRDWELIWFDLAL